MTQINVASLHLPLRSCCFLMSPQRLQGKIARCFSREEPLQMKKLALGALLAAFTAACGGGGGVKLLDGGADAPMACDPIAQTGCATGEKCTWVVDIDANPNANPPTDEIGHNGCVSAANAIADGQTCADAISTTNGGADSCVGGDLCIAGKCKPICDPQLVDGSAKGACATNFSCAIYSGVFVSGGAPTAGVCEPGCDPLTQALLVGTTNLEACGSTDPTKPSGTCVPSGAFTSFHCAPSGQLVYKNVDLVAPLLAPDGKPFGNGCAPGFIPFFFQDSSGSMNVVCSGMCAPVDVDSTIAASAAAGNATTPPNPHINWGDPGAKGKLIADTTSVVGHAICAPSTKGSSMAASTDRGEDCRYVWFPLAQSNSGMTIDSPYNDTLGVCFNFGVFEVDTNMDGKPDTFLKSCSDLSATTTTDPLGTALENGCYSLAKTTMMQAARPPGQKLPHFRSSFRFSYGSTPLMRHVFD